MHELQEQLPRLRAAWIAGGSTAAHCPPAWRTAVGEGPGAEIALLALAGHAAQALFRPTAPAGVAPRPLLPRLAGRTAPEEARVRLRRLLGGKPEEARVRGLVHLIGARGFVMHPGDWLPRPQDDWAPALYAPWLTWVTSKQAPRATAGEDLTAATYDDWPWIERRMELAALRARNPAAARAVIEAKATAEPAERRLKLVDILETGLSDSDIPLLERLSGDRSERVGAEARRLLARLGHGSRDMDLAAELAGMVELARVGLIKRRHQLKLKPLKTQAQEKRRLELMALTPLADLAKALKVEETAFFETMPEGERAALAGFASQVAELGSDAARRAFLDRALEEDDTRPEVIGPLSARTPQQERRDHLPAMVGGETQSFFNESVAFAGDALGAVPFSRLMRAKGYRRLTDAMRNAGSDNAQTRAGADAQLRIGLANLGLLLDVAGARSLIETCEASGLSPADPRLDLLHLNIALNPERSK